MSHFPSYAKLVFFLIFLGCMSVSRAAFAQTGYVELVNTIPGDCTAHAGMSFGTCGQIQLWVRGGAVTLGSPVYTASGDPAFDLPPQTALGCQAGAEMAQNSFCILTQVRFSPTRLGEHSGTVTVTPAVGGSASIPISGTGLPGITVSPNPLQCEDAGVSESGTCELVTVTSIGTVTLNSPAASIGSTQFSIVESTCPDGQPFSGTCTIQLQFHPTFQGTHTAYLQVRINSLSTMVPLQGRALLYSYSWEAGDWGACTGGASSWVIGDWGPEQGCGLTEQVRTVTCAVAAGSGENLREVYCLRSDGVTVEDSRCGTAPRPEEMQTCTPSTDICGEVPEDQREVELTSDCGSGLLSCSGEPGQYCIHMPL